MPDETESYTAASIRILNADEVVERFEWAQIGELAAQYGKDPEWIERGFRACDTAGVGHEYFVDRYLRRDTTVPLHEGVQEAFLNLFVRKAKP
jgi:hypothetical protein